MGILGVGGMGKAYGQRAPRMLGAARLQQQRGLDQALPQHEIDPERRTSGGAGVMGVGDLATGFAQQGIILAEIDTLRATTAVAEGLGEDRRKGLLVVPVSLRKEAVVGAAILLSLVQPFWRAGDGFGLLPA